jgi:hypothetical protein
VIRRYIARRTFASRLVNVSHIISVRCACISQLLLSRKHTTCCRKPFPHCIAVAPSSSPLSSSCFLLLPLLVLALSLSPPSLSLRLFNRSYLSLLTFSRQFLLSSHVRKVDPRSRWQGHPQLPPYQSSRHQAHSSPPSHQPQPSLQALLSLLRRRGLSQGCP